MKANIFPVFTCFGYGLKPLINWWTSSLRWNAISNHLPTLDLFLRLSSFWILKLYSIYLRPNNIKCNCPCGCTISFRSIHDGGCWWWCLTNKPNKKFTLLICERLKSFICRSQHKEKKREDVTAALNLNSCFKAIMETNFWISSCEKYSKACSWFSLFFWLCTIAIQSSLL